jgi:beta-galactosidase
MFDTEGVPCLDAANLVRFGLTGDGRLLDNFGTETGSRVLQLCNGRAQISLQLNGETAVACVLSKGFKTAFLQVKRAK